MLLRTTIVIDLCAQHVSVFFSLFPCPWGPSVWAQSIISLPHAASGDMPPLVPPQAISEIYVSGLRPVYMSLVLFMFGLPYCSNINYFYLACARAYRRRQTVTGPVPLQHSVFLNTVASRNRLPSDNKMQNTVICGTYCCLCVTLVPLPRNTFLAIIEAKLLQFWVHMWNAKRAGSGIFGVGERKETIWNHCPEVFAGNKHRNGAYTAHV